MTRDREKMNTVKGLFIGLLTFFISLGVSAQLTVIPGSEIVMTPLQFVQTYLAGTGVVVSNATFNGSTAPLNAPFRPQASLDQIGSFFTEGGATAQLGITGGVILTTGKAQNTVEGKNTSTLTGGGSDPDLLILASQNILDKAVLEFDFIPETDLIAFNYVFSSVEFDQYCPGGGEY